MPKGAKDLQKAVDRASIRSQVEMDDWWVRGDVNGDETRAEIQ
jgi:hypothetical protein